MRATAVSGATVEVVDWTRSDAPLLELDGVLTLTADKQMRPWCQVLSAYLVEHYVVPAHARANYLTYVDSRLGYQDLRAGGGCCVA